ncbi:replication/maintenance protein RepL [Virgibacillus sp. MSJ-26]|uniref:replication/maintenance protein RepL n=1 Tax=Virgibacillus sp. MSJ-26 TaxID=2841522 RepID=UPI001C1287CE|nr:replication/maintenance protein RepL [Virgibacillus sp. MSJ-26]MBU5468745.1 replication/maintenance protein RepL [Virgibacillus sp. MSJ-26]HJE43255.1 replication/maintenance protein RepL [Enterococcus faecium]
MPQERKESEVIYNGSSRWKNLDTGEIIEANDVIKKTSRNGFMITYLTAIIQLIDNLGNRKMQVVKYILENMEKSTNTLIITTTELAKKSKVSRQTVSDTLKILEESQIIARKTGAIMIHSNLVHRGNHSKEKYLLARFQEWGKDDEGLDI